MAGLGVYARKTWQKFRDDADRAKAEKKRKENEDAKSPGEKKISQWRKDREKEERRKYVSDFDPIDEAKVDDRMTDTKKREARNERDQGEPDAPYRSMSKTDVSKQNQEFRQRRHKEKRGDKKPVARSEPRVPKHWRSLKNKYKFAGMTQTKDGNEVRISPKQDGDSPNKRNLEKLFKKKIDEEAPPRQRKSIVGADGKVRQFEPPIDLRTTKEKQQALQNKVLAKYGRQK